MAQAAETRKSEKAPGKAPAKAAGKGSAKQGDPAAWGADLPGSPILSFNDKWEHLITFLVLVRKWSDGTLDQ